MLDICRPSNIYIFVHSLSPFDKSESKFNRPFYQYGGHIKFIRFKEYYGMPRGHLLSIYVCLGKKSFIVYFSEKRQSLLHPNTAQQSFSKKT